MYSTSKNRPNRAARLRGLSMWLVFTGIICAHAYAESEAALRVAFVYNFIKFIEWPATETNSVIKLCASTTDVNTQNALQELRGKTANKRVIELLYLRSDELANKAIDDCNMLYLTQASTSKSLPDPLPNGVVLVADDPSELHNNVSIELHRNPEGRIEFAVNSNAVTHAGVNISSQLLKLAKKSRRRNG